MSKTSKNKPSFSMQEVLGGDMKDMIDRVNRVEQPESVVSKDDKKSTETTEISSMLNLGKLDEHLNFYLGRTVKKQPIWVDIELFDEIEQLTYKLKNMKNIRYLPKSALLNAVLKTFLEENGDKFK